MQKEQMQMNVLCNFAFFTLFALSLPTLCAQSSAADDDDIDPAPPMESDGAKEIVLGENAQIQLVSALRNYLTRIAGLTARLQCTIYHCRSSSSSGATSLKRDNDDEHVRVRGNSSSSRRVKLLWYKNDVLIFNGTEFNAFSQIDPSHVMLQRSTKPDADCAAEEFHLLIRNLTRQDAGTYRCALEQTNAAGGVAPSMLTEQLDFQMDVLESGLKPTFYTNYTFNHIACCLERGVSPLCRAMCKPRDMDLEFFDPISCLNEDYANFLECVTDKGERDYTPCCRKKNIPEFCYDFCDNGFRGLTRSSRLCLYYMPDFFDCFNRLTDLNPPPVPTVLHVKTADQFAVPASSWSLCWKIRPIEFDYVKITSYIVRVRPIMNETLQTEKGTRSARTTTNPRNSGVRVMLIFDRELLSSNHTTTPSDELLNLKPQSKFVEQANVKETKTTQEVCAELGDISIISPASHLRFHPRHSYLVTVQSVNDFGASQPSRPFFLVVPPSSSQTKAR